jgi:hypothetical protein
VGRGGRISIFIKADCYSPLPLKKLHRRKKLKCDRYVEHTHIKTRQDKKPMASI